MAPLTGTPAARGIPPSAVAAFGAAILIQLALVVTGPSNAGTAMLLAAVGLAAVFIGLASPVLAVLLFLLAAFLRLALPDSVAPVDPFLLAFAGVFASAAIGVLRRVNRLPQLGAVEAFMLLYLVWSIGSALLPHTYPAAVPVAEEDVEVWRFIISGTVIPFVLYGIGRFVFDRDAVLRRLLWFVLGLAAYSAAVSVMQFHGPTALVWPRFIVEDPSWAVRAVGVLDQPVVNGLVLIIGFTLALHLAHQSATAPWRRAALYGVAAIMAYGVYLTHTRVIWLAFAIVLIGGAVLARGWRSGYLTAIGAAVVGIAVNWSDFTSAHRAAGGIASDSEVQDRLNALATSFWAIAQKPIAGWGIGRFAPVNTYHHQRWSPDVDWIRGYGIASHFNEVGIAVELGLVGLALWLAVLGLVAYRLLAAWRLLPEGGAHREVALVALLSFVALLLTGATVDLRFFILPTALVWLLVGIAVGHADRQRAAALEPAAGVVEHPELAR
jgi:O-antigen ligase